MNEGIFSVLLTLACCGYAAWRGGAPERTASAIILIGSVATTLALSRFQVRFRSVELPVLVIDTIVWIAMAALAAKANRLWPFLLFGLQSVGILGHVAKIIDPAMSRALYGEITQFGIYPMLAVLAAGTKAHVLRLGKLGGDRSWVRSSRRSAPPTA